MTRLSEKSLKVDGWSSEFRSVDRWLKHYGRKTQSEHTKRNAADILVSFLRFVEESDPDRYVRNSRSKVEMDFQEFLDGMKSRGLSLRYINVCHAYLSSFFEQNGFRKGKELEVERYHQPSRYRKRSEYIPTAEEAWEMVENGGNPKDRALIGCLYTSGLRNSSVRALLLSDVETELERGVDSVRVPVYPEMKRVDPDACKNSIPYYSFISRDASRILRTYVSEVRRRLGEFGEGAPLFVGERIKGKVTHVKARTLQIAVHEAARKAGVRDWKNVYPHCLRKTFQSVLKAEYSDGGRMDPKDQEFLMGHILPGSQDAYYDKSKVEQLRSEYSRLVFRRESEAFSEEKFRASFRKELLSATKMSDDEMEKLDLIRMGDNEFQQIIQRRLLRTMTANGSRQKVVGAEEVNAYIGQGWEYVASLPDKKAVVRIPVV